MFERVTKAFTVRGVSWRSNRTATYWPPSLMAITAFLSLSPGLLNRGPVGPASLGRGPHSSILSPTDLNPTDWTSWAPSYKIVQRPPPSYGRHKLNSIQPVHGQGYILIFLDRMHLLFTQVHFLFWELGWGQYVTQEPIISQCVYFNLSSSPWATIHPDAF